MFKYIESLPMFRFFNAVISPEPLSSARDRGGTPICKQPDRNIARGDFGLYVVMGTEAQCSPLSPPSSSTTAVMTASPALVIEPELSADGIDSVSELDEDEKRFTGERRCDDKDGNDTTLDLCGDGAPRTSSSHKVTFLFLAISPSITCTS